MATGEFERQPVLQHTSLLAHMGFVLQDHKPFQVGKFGDELDQPLDSLRPRPNLFNRHKFALFDGQKRFYAQHRPQDDVWPTHDLIFEHVIHRLHVIG